MGLDVLWEVPVESCDWSGMEVIGISVIGVL
jgi:hypothetical protein